MEQPGVASALIRQIDGELSKQRHRHRIGLIAVALSRQRLALDLQAVRATNPMIRPAAASQMTFVRETPAT